MKLICLALSLLIFTIPAVNAAPRANESAPTPHWILQHKITGFEHDLQTDISSRGAIARPGLISVSRRGGHVMTSWWQHGAFRPTIEFDGRIVIEGKDLTDISRIGSVRFDKAGSLVWVRTTKGPGALVELYQDGHTQLTWPRQTPVSIVSYSVDEMIISIFLEKSGTTQFWQYQRSTLSAGFFAPELVGALEDCTLLTSSRRGARILLEVYCSSEKGSDILALDIKTGKVSEILATSDDDILAFGLAARKGRDDVPVLTISGSRAARHFYHAATASLLKSPADPMSRASDETGKQSWSQSWRTMSLATLFEKTRHPALALLARNAMEHTLDNQNGALGHVDARNPSCAWSSRIYSDDGQKPLSLLVNQAMISTSLIKSCKALGAQCSGKLQTRIDTNAACLVTAFERDFDTASGLYRIPYGISFRFDGHWAPWNWQMTWAAVVDHVAQIQNDKRLHNRVQGLTSMFLKEWEMPSKANAPALWRYWPAPYYRGWQAGDHISLARPRQNSRDMTQQRYEDVAHAGISLFALSEMNLSLSARRQSGVTATLEAILQGGNLYARDIDGTGPRAARWLPGAGWHAFAGEAMRALYENKLPGASSGDQHFAYARLYDPAADFDLQMTLSLCRDKLCEASNKWRFKSQRNFLSDNPLFRIWNKPEEANAAMQQHRESTSRAPTHE